MVKFDYRCSGCGKYLEITAKMGDAPTCTSCTCGCCAERVYTKQAILVRTYIKGAKSQYYENSKV